MISSKIKHPYKIKVSKKTNKKNQVQIKPRGSKTETEEMSLCILILNWKIFSSSWIRLQSLFTLLPSHFMSLTRLRPYYFYHISCLVIEKQQPPSVGPTSCFCMKPEEIPPERESGRCCCDTSLSHAASSSSVRPLVYIRTRRRARPHAAHTVVTLITTSRLAAALIRGSLGLSWLRMWRMV